MRFPSRTTGRSRAACFGVEWAEFRDAFPSDVGLEDESVDLAFSWTVLEHVPELPPMMAEMARVVRRAG